MPTKYHHPSEFTRPSSDPGLNALANLVCIRMRNLNLPHPVKVLSINEYGPNSYDGTSQSYTWYHRGLVEITVGDMLIQFRAWIKNPTPDEYWHHPRPQRRSWKMGDTAWKHILKRLEIRCIGDNLSVPGPCVAQAVTWGKDEDGYWPACKDCKGVAQGTPSRPNSVLPPNRLQRDEEEKAMVVKLLTAYRNQRG